jgi:hypothetical protein
MRALVVVGGLVGMILTSCASVGTPHAPLATSAGGRRCVRQCQALHERCVAGANRELGESYWNFLTPPIRACDDDLGRCYGTCPSS